MPKIRNLIKDNPNYPDDVTLKQEILAYKRKGLKVMMSPQICCNDPNFQNRSKEWWDVFFSETTNFLVHHARIAQETGVDYFQYYVRGDYQGADYATRYSQFFREVRKVYSGKVGQGVWNFAQEPTIFPNAKYITWGLELDYFYVAIDHPIFTKDNPTDEGLEAGAGAMLDGVKELYSAFKKPIFIRTTYFNVAQTWRGNSFYSISDVPWVIAPESDLKTGKYRQSGEDLARVVNAYFQSIAERPWVVGYGQFGYAHWENPLSAELSVRGKQTEDVWRKWNEVIYK